MLESKLSDSEAVKAGEKLFNAKVKELKDVIAQQRQEILASVALIERRVENVLQLMGWLENKKQYLLLENELTELNGMHTELVQFIEKYNAKTAEQLGGLND